MRTRFKPWAIALLSEHPELVINENNLDDSFLKSDNLSLELGAGKGDFIVQMAKKYPEKHFLAVEKCPTIAGIMLKKIIDQEISNLRVIPLDGELILKTLKSNSLNALYLNFPDPWPKKRHEKRRLFADRFLFEYYRLLKDNARLYFKSDNIELFNYAIESLSKTKFKRLSEVDNFIDAEIESEYEKRFKNLNIKINRLVYQK